MAIEFGSRKETFPNFKVYETMLAGRPFRGNGQDVRPVQRKRDDLLRRYARALQRHDERQAP